MLKGQVCGRKLLGSTRYGGGGRCIHFQNQIQIFKGPNSFWGAEGWVVGNIMSRAQLILRGG